MTMTRILTTSAAAAVALLLAACVIAPGPAPSTPDGLRQVKSARVDSLYVAPGLSLARYGRVQIDVVDVAFKQDWQARHPDVSADDVAMILHTSGTTSRPKRVPIRHRNLAASAANIGGTYSLSADDVALCVMPLFHIHGIVASMLSTLASGGTVVCPDGFNALEFWG